MNFFTTVLIAIAFALWFSGGLLIDERNKAQLEVAGLRKAARISGEM